jgi:hypothetical protein
MTKNDSPCKSPAVSGGEYCVFHMGKVEQEQEKVTENLQKATEKPPLTKKEVQWATNWKPATLLNIPEHMKDSNYHYRFVDTARPYNVQKRLEEGYEVDKELSNKLSQIPGTINDGSTVDGTSRARELLVMRCRKEVAEGRKQYIKNKTMQTEQSLNRLKSEKGDSQALTNLGLSGESVGNVPVRPGSTITIERENAPA